MAFPSTLVRDVRVGDLGTATPGTLVSVLRDHKVLTALALGIAGAPATQVLIEVDGLPWVYAIDAMRDPRALHMLAAERLVLDIGDDIANVNQLRNYIGCLGLTSEGLVVCAAGGRDEFRSHVQVFVALSTHRLLEAGHELLLGAVWFTNWTLAYRNANDELTRLMGNPVWPEGTRLA